MRELVFALEYASGADPIADVLSEYPKARVRSQACHVTTDSLWRIDHAIGSASALTALEDQYLDPDVCADCLTLSCDSDGETHVLDRGEDFRVFYIRWSKTPHCTSIPHVALSHLGTGLLFETIRSERQYRWRILAPDDAGISAFHASLREEVGDYADIDLQRIQPVDSWTVSQAGSIPLSEKQRSALLAAVNRGYYETPREIDLGELADDLGVPHSTLSYRLRRAEARLATAVAERERRKSIALTE